MSWKGRRPANGCYSHADRVTFNAIKKSERAAKKARATRLARRDAEYAASGVEVTVEERNGVVIETRGRCCISSRCGVISQGDTRTLAEIAKPSISECESVRKARERMRRKSKGGKSCKR